MQRIWTIRESVTIALNHEAKRSKSSVLFKYDISVPVTDVNDTVMRIKQNLALRGYLTSNTNVGQSLGGTIDVFCFGHMGDENLHLNVMYYG